MVKKCSISSKAKSQDYFGSFMGPKWRRESVRRHEAEQACFEPERDGERE